MTPRLLSVIEPLPAPPDVAPLAELLKTLADEHRLAIVALLARGELCVCHLVEILGLPQSTLSHHVGVLRRAGLIRDRRDPSDGRWIYYSLDPAAIGAMQRELAGLLRLGEVAAHEAGRPAPPCP
jgi:ArsR family transcriptional regulator